MVDLIDYRVSLNFS